MSRYTITRRDAILAIGSCLTTLGCSKTGDNSEAGMLNNYQHVVDALEHWRKLHVRQAYRPVIKTDVSSNHVSRFGGVPLLGTSDNWPLCGKCSQPMHLLLQLDLEALPERLDPLSSGVLQVFYCTRMDFDTKQFCDDYQAFSVCHHIRVLQESQLSPYSGSVEGYAFPSVGIVGWKPFDDLPDGMEHDRLGLRYEYEFSPGVHTTSVHWDEGNIHFEDIACTNDHEGSVESAIASAASKDKLLGWPMWIQDVEYPSCTQCHGQMSYLFQIDSEDNIPHMFGDVGCGHISYCPKHPDILAFTWACS